MKNNFNFPIKSNGSISTLFLQKNIADFKQAMQFIRQLPYGRNKNKYDLTTIFSDNCGTCSTKNALLKTLAAENDQHEVKLILGLFKMGKKYSVSLGEVLAKNKLTYIPEAHNYLKINDVIFDCTTSISTADQFVNELISEIEIEAGQITDFKVNYHKVYLRQWLAKQEGLTITFDKLWSIREKCIEVLGYLPEGITAKALRREGKRT
jgi:hypothetical protein